MNWDDLSASTTEIVGVESTERRRGTLPNVVTSADVKLTYNTERDSFVPYLLGDINANPEGLRIHEEKSDRPVLELVARAFLSNVSGTERSVVVNLPESVFDTSDNEWVDKDRWIVSDKQAVVDTISELQSVCTVFLTAGARGISQRDSTITYDRAQGQVQVDGYVNLTDWGVPLQTALDSDVNAMSKGANAPTGVWNPQFETSGKLGLLREAKQLVHQRQGVELPRFTRIETVSDVRNFYEELGRRVVVKGPYGTWGDEVVVVDDPQSIRRKALEKEQIVRDKRSFSDFSILCENKEEFCFNSRANTSHYGVVEEAIAGTFERDNVQYETFEIPPRCHPDSENSPIDFVPLVVRDTSAPGSTDSTVVSTVVRVSSKPDLNANAGTEYVNYYTLEEIRDGSVAIPNPRDEATFDVDLWELLERTAGRTVTSGELQDAIRAAGHVAFAVRNRCGTIAENQL
ncbi:hypothetical protein [Halosimplex pelagicum]|uniref:ATP-grasp domain-containing protein n=1 Tax=Halosimplex pelagicum TaxID=869886 RepID=A0A7D5P542_9EURY|nr:hypothetical protein [Halosimplex pelagicum]QLH81077.1 hypothetical protein HZS54_05230 [Halosimplex pelagicum]